MHGIRHSTTGIPAYKADSYNADFRTTVAQAA